MSPTRRVALTYIVFFAAVGAYFPYLPVYYRSLGLGLGEIGLISAVWSAAQLLGAPAWGNLADRRSRSSWTLPAALLVAGVGAIALALSRDFPTVVASAVVMAFGLSGFGPVLDARSLELLGADRIRYGQLRAWGSASFVVATIGVGIVLDARGTEALFLICLPLFLLAAAVAGTLPRRGSAHVAVGFLSGTGQVLRSRQLAPFFASALLVLMGLAAVTAFYSVAYDGLGGDRLGIGLAWAIGAAVETPIMFGYPRLARRFGTDRLLVLGASLLALRSLLAALAQEPVLLVLIAPIEGVAWGTFFISSIDYVGRHAPAGLSATSQGVYTATNGLAAILGSALGGLIAEATSIAILFGLAAALGGLAAVLLAIAIRERPPVSGPGPAPA
jgi:PPP family 3-phenylpropionic acid transporter